MGTRLLARSFATLISIALAAAAVPRHTACAADTAAPTTEVIYSFLGAEDGEYASTDLYLDPTTGRFYGTTVQGGSYGAGTVFCLQHSQTGWQHSVIYNFRGLADGGQPYGGVTVYAGNIYGTAVIGGTSGVCEEGCGVVWKLTNVGGQWVETVLHDFTGGDDGSGPGGPVSIDWYGNIYGMTPIGGQYGLGTIYKLTPNGDFTYQFDVLHAFTGGLDGGAASPGRLTYDYKPTGYVYGVATVGGAYGSGVVFRVSSTGGGYETLYSFAGQPDASFPYGAVVFDQLGNLYGTTYYGGANGLGTVYQLTPSSSGWQESVIYSFRGGTDGAFPIGTVLLGNLGMLFGSTSEGGATGCDCGTIFRLARQNGIWSERVIHRFRNSPDGAFPYNSLVRDWGGNLWGATVHGGDDGEGAIFSVRAGVAEVTKGAEVYGTESLAAPLEGLAIVGAFPNPFRDAGVSVRYAVPSEGRVRVAVYGMDGRLVRVVSDRVESAGTHEAVWNGLTDQGAVASRGVYICEVQSAGVTERVRVTSLR